MNTANLEIHFSNIISRFDAETRNSLSSNEVKVLHSAMRETLTSTHESLIAFLKSQK